MKRIIGLILVILMIFSLVGCKSKGNINADDEIAVVAGSESQIDIDNNENTEKPEENKETVIEEQPLDTSDDETTLTDADDTQTTEIDQNASKKVNQVELENQPRIEEESYDWWFTFNSISELVDSLKTKKYVDITPEKDRQDYKYKHTQERINLDAQKGISTDYRFDLWNTDKIEYFYKIKDIPGYTLKRVSMSSDKYIYYMYYPISSDKSTDDTELDISVLYRRVDSIITDSYFNDYLEYYKNTTVTEDGFMFKDYHEEHGFAVIMFPVENTVIEITAKGDMANYEALKKLCVAEKVVVE